MVLVVLNNDSWSRRGLTSKKAYGQFYTKKNMWLKPHVKEFIKTSGATLVVDPFAGKGDLIGAMRDIGFKNAIGFDIDPRFGWEINDSLLSIPYYDNAIVVTNPPYFGKSSAKRNKSEAFHYFKDNKYVDLYQIALDKVLSKYTHAVFIIPETYLLSPFFKHYLESITIIEEGLFDDTDCPVCVCCFKKNNSFVNLINKEYKIYKNNEFLFTNKKLEETLDKFYSRLKLHIRFNDREGNLGLRAIDGTSPNDRIRFCFPCELGYDLNKVTHSSRSITVINIKREGLVIDQTFINIVNDVLNSFRLETKDVLLAPFKNNNKEGIRRRRLDFLWAKNILKKSIDIYYGGQGK